MEDCGFDEDDQFMIIMSDIECHRVFDSDVYTFRAEVTCVSWD